MMSALRRLRRSCSFEFPADASEEFRDSVSVLLAVALAETEAELLEETSPPPLLLEFPCPESEESWLGLISRSAE